MLDTSQICIVTKDVIANDFEVRRFFHSKCSIGDQRTSWVFLHGNEEAGFLDDVGRLSFMPLSEVILQRPFVREYLGAQVGGNFTFDEETGRVFDWTEQRTLSFARRVMVPTAARVRFELLSWLRLYPTDAYPGAVAVSSVIAAIFHHPAWLLVTVYFSTMAIVRYVGLFEHFKLGEARPSIVVSTKPFLIATEGEFVSWGKPKRLVKVIKLRRRAFSVDQRANGTIIPTAVLYKNPTWYNPLRCDLTPLPVNYATRNPIEIAKALDRILPGDLESLHEAITHLPRRIRARIYVIPQRELPDDDPDAL